MTKHMKHRSLWRNESGNVFIMVALGLIMLVTSIAVAVDMTRAFLVRSKAQAALDAALIGVASIAHKGISQNEIDERARNFFDANFPLGYMDTTRGDPVVTFDETKGKVAGNVSVNFKPAFAKILTEDGFSIDTSGETTRILGKDLEIALALDHTSSMCAKLAPCSSGTCTGAPCTGSTAGTRINVLKDAVQILFEEVEAATEATTDPDAKVLYSYVPFNHDVKINGTVMHNGANYLPTIRGLREDPTPIINAMNAITINNTGNTNAAKGVSWGWRSLREGDRARFTGASAHQYADHPKPAGDDDTIKAIVILSDGLNEFTYYASTDTRISPDCNPNGCPNPFPDMKNPTPTVDRDTANANDDQIKICDGINREGIAVFPILLNTNTATAAGVAAKNICDRCATGPADAHSARVCYTPNTAEELRDVFRQIARQLINLRITK